MLLGLLVDAWKGRLVNAWRYLQLLGDAWKGRLVDAWRGRLLLCCLRLGDA